MKTMSENKKAMPKFILIMIGSLLLGALLGVGIVFADGSWTEQLPAALLSILRVAAPYLLFATFILSVSSVVILLRRAKKLHKNWNEEDEQTLQQMDGLINVALIINNVCTILSFFFVGIPFCCSSEMGMGIFFLCLFAFICNLAAMIIGQQKLVDFAKLLYPEKHGSVYDIKFEKKWYESCDEAERAMIGQAGMAAYKATNTLCLALWMFLALGNMLFDMGLLPIAIVTAIWLTSTLSYCISTIKLSKVKK